jgi:hypothetical protein
MFSPKIFPKWDACSVRLFSGSNDFGIRQRNVMEFDIRAKLERVTTIQRANTVGGMAPEDGCSQATLGAPARIAYSADYYFFSAR